MRNQKRLKKHRTGAIPEATSLIVKTVESLIITTESYQGNYYIVRHKILKDLDGNLIKHTSEWCLLE